MSESAARAGSPAAATRIAFPVEHGSRTIARPKPIAQRVMRVLLLEDSRFDAELVQEALLAHCPLAEVTWVRDEAGFIEALAGGGWQLVLSDFELPSFSGAQALELTRRIAPELPFIFVSGVIGEDNAVELLKRGATDYVSKGRLARLPVVLERALRELDTRSARAEAESRLREAGLTYERVVDSLRDHAVILLDLDGRITSWNRAAHEMLGHDAAAVLGTPIESLLTDEDRASGAIGQVLRAATATGKSASQRWMVRCDGSRLWTEGTVTPLSMDDGMLGGFCFIARDTTTEHQAREALRVAAEQAEAARQETERASRAKDRFLAVLSHELRNPLSPISFATHLLEKTAAVPDKYRDLLPMIRRNVALEARLIDDLLDLSTITSGKLSLKPAPVEMNELVRETANMVAEALAQRNLRLELVLSPEPVVVRADAARIQQVISNLLRNAIKFSHPDGVVRLRSALVDGRYELRCEDQGIGIAREALERIFTAFEQADREVARRLGGLGLGLAIARHLVVEHGGELLAESPGRDQGATFTLRLPCISHEDVPALATVGSTTADRPPMRSANDDGAGRPGDLPDGTRVAVPARESGDVEAVDGVRLLLVEDNPQAAQTLRLFLEEFGYEVTVAGTVADAIRHSDSERFDVVLTDLGLPDGSGVEIGRTASARMPVVALSGYGAAIDLQRTAAAGFAGHLVKPADPQEVHAVLQRVIAEFAQRRVA